MSPIRTRARLRRLVAASTLVLASLAASGGPVDASPPDEESFDDYMARCLAGLEALETASEPYQPFDLPLDDDAEAVRIAAIEFFAGVFRVTPEMIEEYVASLDGRRVELLSSGSSDYFSTSTQVGMTCVEVDATFEQLATSAYFEVTVMWAVDGLPAIVANPNFPAFTVGASALLGLTFAEGVAAGLYFEADESGDSVEYANPLPSGFLEWNGRVVAWALAPLRGEMSLAVTHAKRPEAGQVGSVTTPPIEPMVYGSPADFTAALADPAVDQIRQELAGPATPPEDGVPAPPAEDDENAEDPVESGANDPEETTTLGAGDDTAAGETPVIVESPAPATASDAPSATTSETDESAAVQEETNDPETDDPETDADDATPAAEPSSSSSGGGLALVLTLVSLGLIALAVLVIVLWRRRSSTDADAPESKPDDDRIDPAAVAVAMPGAGVLADPCVELRKKAASARNTFEVYEKEATRALEKVREKRRAEPPRDTKPAPLGTLGPHAKWTEDLSKLEGNLDTAARLRSEARSTMLDLERKLAACEKRHLREERELIEAASDMSPASKPTPKVGTTKFKVRTIVGGEVSVPARAPGANPPLGIATYNVEIADDQGNSVLYTFSGIGGSMGTPSISGPSSWTEFTTSEPMTVTDFEGWGTWSFAGGALVVGAGYTEMTFECGDRPDVSADGFGVGTGGGAGVSTYHGSWEIR